MTSDDTFDVLVLGAGPAGAAAALFAAHSKLRTAVCDRAAEWADGVGLEWMPRAGRALLKDAAADISGAIVATIERVRFVDAANGRVASTQLDEPIDLIDVVRLRNVVLDAAVRAGAVRNCSTDVTTIDVGEDWVKLAPARGSTLTGRVLLLADGAAAAADRARRVVQPDGAPSRGACCEWMSSRKPLQQRSGADRRTELCLILDARNPDSYGYAFAVGDTRVVGLVSDDSQQDIKGEFECALRRWTEANLISAEGAGAKTATVRLVPRGMALEIDTHVGKRTISIGAAGGYISSLAHDGLYPGFRSARIAVDVARSALSSSHPQDALAEFDLAWRRELVDYLRMPNTDLRFLIPLVFTNELMAARLAMAFLAGGNI